MENEQEIEPGPKPGFLGNPNIIGASLALLCVAVWSANFIVGRGVAEAVPPITLSFMRWFVAFCAIAPFTVLSVYRNRRHFLTHWKYYTLVALVGVSMINTFIYIAAHTVPALNLSLIAASSPLFVLILARVFYGDPITPVRLIGICVVLAGILLLITRGDFAVLARLDFHLGDLYMLAGAFCFAVYTLLMRKPPAGAKRFDALAVMFGVGLIFLVPLYVWEAAKTPPVHYTPSIIAVFLYCGLGASVFCYWLWAKGISYIGPARAAIIYYSMPLFCGVEAIIFLGESVLWVHYISGAMILGGLLVATKPAKK